MILISNGGSNTGHAAAPSDYILVGTVDGVVLLSQSGKSWTVSHRALEGIFVSALTLSDAGTLFAATRGVGVARSVDGGITWTWANDGLSHFDFWSARAGRLMG